MRSVAPAPARAADEILAAVVAGALWPTRQTSRPAGRPAGSASRADTFPPWSSARALLTGWTPSRLEPSGTVRDTAVKRAACFCASQWAGQGIGAPGVLTFVWRAVPRMRRPVSGIGSAHTAAGKVDPLLPACAVREPTALTRWRLVADIESYLAANHGCTASCDWCTQS